MFLPNAHLILGEPPGPKSSVLVRISNYVSGGQCHLVHLTILGCFFWPMQPTCAQRWPKTSFMLLHSSKRALRRNVVLKRHIPGLHRTDHREHAHRDVKTASPICCHHCHQHGLSSMQKNNTASSASSQQNKVPTTIFQQTQNICITFIQCWTDVGLTLY